MKHRAFFFSAMLSLLFCAAALAGPARPITSGNFLTQANCGPGWDSQALQGQWFSTTNGITSVNAWEYCDDTNSLTIAGVAQNIKYSIPGDASSPIISFDILATVQNNLPMDYQYVANATNSHGEVLQQPGSTSAQTMLDTRITAEFAIADPSMAPSGTSPYWLDPVAGNSYFIEAVNEHELAWYCWDPNSGLQPAGQFQVPAWNLGTIPPGGSAQVLMSFAVTGAGGMPISDYRHSVIRASQANGWDVLYNRHPSLKISHWLDTLLIDAGYNYSSTPPAPWWEEEPVEHVYASDASVFYTVEEQPEYDHKMHWPQLPDPNGWDVRACSIPPTDPNPDGLRKVLADDFMCMSNGLINHITFWGSWFSNQFTEVEFHPYQGITNIHLSIHSDYPDLDEEGPLYSHPDILLWEWDIDPAAPPAGWILPPPVEEEPSWQGWYDPNLPQGENFQLNNHDRYFRYEIFIPNDEAFFQTVSNIYWLDISVETTNGLWGWKTTLDHWNDDAVWTDMPVLDPAQWNELRDPIEPDISLDLAFIIDEYVEEEEYDFGDAPDTGAGTGPGNYETLQADNGAYHNIVPATPYFDDGSGGDQPDPEPDGQPDPTAMGDDNNGVSPDDEDGITWPVPLIIGQAGSVDIMVDDGAGGTGSGGGYVYAWIDWNADGDWLDSNEQIYAGWMPQGLNNVGFTVPASATTGQTFARFRITSSQTALSPTGGPAPDGEVEDHEINIEEPQTFDWGDAMDPTYPTVSANNGANHLIVSGILLGANIDSEPDGQPNANATGDDIAGVPDDEDGVTFVPLNPIPGKPGQVSVTVAGTGYLNVWFDWANDGSWSEAGDHVSVDVPLSTGTHLLNFNAPTNMPWGTQLFSRFRFSSVSNLTYTGGAPDGEVEDHAFTTREPPDHELGDAPDSSNNFMTNMTAYPMGGPAGVVANFPTVYGSGSPAPVGPIHWQPLVQAHLGFQVSREEEADVSPDEDVINNILPLLNQPDNDGDDDALASSGPLSLPHCRSTTLTYDATWTGPIGSSMWVNVWFDWNRDGDWNDTITCPDGSTVPEWAVQNDLLPIPIPQAPPWPKYINATTPSFTAWHPSVIQTPIWMRITLAEKQWPATGAIAGGEGPASGYLYGETEDYYITSYELADEFDFGDAPDSPYLTLLPSGARHYMIPGFNLGSQIDYETNGLPDITATGDDLDGVDDEDGVTMGSLIRGSNTVANITLTSGAGGGVLDAWVDFNGNGTWAPAEKIFSGVTLLPGSNTLFFAVPTTAALGTNYARFRLTQSGISSPGGAAPDGEVEDYQVILLQPVPSPDIIITNIAVDASNSVATVQWNAQNSITYQMQSTTNLLISNSWINVGGSVVGPFNTQTNAAAPTNQFYRIMAPWTP